MSRTTRRREAMTEVDAHLDGAHHGLQALLTLLAACRQPLTLEPRGLQVLLAPVADQVEQAAQVVQLLQQPGR